MCVFVWGRGSFLGLVPLVHLAWTRDFLSFGRPFLASYLGREDGVECVGSGLCVRIHVCARISDLS